MTGDSYDGELSDDAEALYNAKLAEEVAKLNEYRQSLEQEFKNLDLDDPEAHKRIKAEVHKLVPDACTTLKMMLEHAESESVRANIAKFVLTVAMKTADKETASDIVAEMFADLAANDDTTQSIYL